MDNQAKQALKKGILGSQSENPYSSVGEIDVQEQPIDHQATFEAQVKQEKKQSQVDVESQTYAFEQNGTYCRTGNFENGFIETDLKIVKQKGVEERCVSFTIITQAEEAEVYEENNLILVKMEMRSEEQFNNFKNFVANLEWND
jgi:hypothetical protein